MDKNNLKYCILVSGNLGFIALNYLVNKTNIEIIFTDTKSTDISNLAKELKIPCFIGNPRKSVDLVNNFVSNKSIDILLSVNYLFIIEENIIQLPKLFAINIHGSLLPKYRGRTPHVWAIINGEKETGITAHILDKECDNGDIIKQLSIQIDDNMTGADILKMFTQKYLLIIDLIIEDIESNSINRIKQDKEKATYFGKRTPEDGLINWNWQKERIKNWVRAQSFPYPGAFTLYNKTKIIIDEIKFNDLGYSYDIPNGTIIKIDKLPFVKTPNGVIEIIKIRNAANTNFELNRKFDEAL